MELNVEEARYVTSPLYIKYNWIGEAITVFYKYFFLLQHTPAKYKVSPNFSGREDREGDITALRVKAEQIQILSSHQEHPLFK